MIEVAGLTKYYGQLAAIEDVTFSVEKGEIIGFLGPNAAGKTTTMRILTGFSPPSRGKAMVAGFDITERPIEVKRRVGYMPESVPLYGEMVVSGFLAYVAEVKGVARAERKREVARVMERCGLEQMSDRLVAHLSKGYRQRVGLAQALVGNPPVLILDEPTVGLDPKQIIEIRQMIKDLGHEHTVLLSTHILPEVTMVCERVIIIDRGRVVAQDSMAALAEGGSPLLEVTVDGPEEKVRAAIEQVPGVASCVSKGSGRYRVEGAAGQDPSAALTESLVRSGLAVRELRKHARTLEDVFIGVVSADAQAVSDQRGAGR